jgi:ribosomal protein L16 Arg81 hydroxylase
MGARFQQTRRTLCPIVQHRTGSRAQKAPGQLPLLASMVDGILANTAEQHQTFTEVKAKPHVLDDDIVNRAIRLYQAQLDDLWFYEEQLARWQKESLTASQRQEVNRLAGQLPPGAPRARELSETILELLDEIEDGTINRILGKVTSS